MLSNCKYIELFDSSQFLRSEWLFLIIFWRSAAVGEIEADFLERVFAIILNTFVLEHAID